VILSNGGFMIKSEILSSEFVITEEMTNNEITAIFKGVYEDNKALIFEMLHGMEDNQFLQILFYPSYALVEVVEVVDDENYKPSGAFSTIGLLKKTADEWWINYLIEYRTYKTLKYFNEVMESIRQTIAEAKEFEKERKL
jgi:hypothetical protein